VSLTDGKSRSVANYRELPLSGSRPLGLELKALRTELQVRPERSRSGPQLPPSSRVAAQARSVLFTELQPDSERSRVAARSFLFAEFQLNRESELYLSASDSGSNIPSTGTEHRSASQLANEPLDEPAGLAGRSLTQPEQAIWPTQPRSALRVRVRYSSEPERKWHQPPRLKGTYFISSLSSHSRYSGSWPGPTQKAICSAARCALSPSPLPAQALASALGIAAPSCASAHRGRPGNEGVPNLQAWAKKALLRCVIAMNVPTEEVQHDSSPMRRVLSLVPAMVSFEVSAQLSRTAQTVESTALSSALHSQKPTASSAYYSSGRAVTHTCSALHMRVPSQPPPWLPLVTGAV
jgi:hypothetical protein